KMALTAGVTGSLMAAAFAAQAGTSATLTITGLVTPSACAISLSDSGTLTFDPVSIEALPESGSYTMEPKTIDALVDCKNTEQAVAISFVDNRQDSVAAHSDEPTGSSTAFGLGKTDDNLDIGSYGIKISKVTAEGETGSLLTSSGNKLTDTWTSLSSDTFVNNGTVAQYITYTDSDGSAPVSKKNYTFTLEVSPSISSALKAITSTANLDGNATINVDYM
ncbi:DUF1120 domain-containing protein, partial [Salmonella enterica]|nr:hypothetical protein [Salmonella enterica subsp. enterica serovar Lattenkamp]EMD1356147.1 DUF1120 domain-containing protein [Salmonella enterica]